MQTMTAKEFERHPKRALKQAQTAPLLITRQGKPAFVVTDYDQYQAAAPQKSALDVLTALPPLADALEDIEFEIPPRSHAQRPPVDFGEI